MTKDKDNVRIIFDAHDRTKDKIVPRDLAREGLVSGHLYWDIANQCYCTKESKKRKQINA